MQQRQGSMYFFGYGVSVNPKFLQQYGIDPIAQQPARLQDHTLVFNVRDYFRLEGGTANIQKSTNNEVHGIIYQLNPSHTPALVEMHSIFYRQAEISVQGQDGKTYDVVKVFIGVADYLEQGLQPSERYIDIMLAASKLTDIPDTYIAQLQAQEVRPTPA
ncbi:MAG: gamma-glutamylcyclotransferase, partial [Pseudomonadota bacterium]|nr:gamma-glutamylcyclotransferase [Pseudomonadota bacterium]